MADVNHLISLGIGVPGDVAHFTLFGLSPKVVQPSGKFVLLDVFQPGMAEADAFQSGGKLQDRFQPGAQTMDRF